MSKKTTLAGGAAALWLVPCAVLAQQVPNPDSPAGEIALPDVTVTAPACH